MRHKLKISVSKKPLVSGALACRSVSVHEKILRFLFGEERRVIILIPGDSVEEIVICEAKEG